MTVTYFCVWDLKKKNHTVDIPKCYLYFGIKLITWHVLLFSYTYKDTPFRNRSLFCTKSLVHSPLQNDHRMAPLYRNDQSINMIKSTHIL